MINTYDLDHNQNSYVEVTLGQGDHRNDVDFGYASGIVVDPPQPWHETYGGWRQRYTLTWANRTDHALTHATMAVAIPPHGIDVLLDQSSPGASLDGRYVIWSVGTVAPGETVVRYLEIRVWSGLIGTSLEICLIVNSDQQSMPAMACSTSLVKREPQAITPTQTLIATATQTPTPQTPLPTATPTASSTLEPRPGSVWHIPFIVVGSTQPDPAVPLADVRQSDQVDTPADLGPTRLPLILAEETPIPAPQATPAPPPSAPARRRR